MTTEREVSAEQLAIAMMAEARKLLGAPDQAVLLAEWALEVRKLGVELATADQKAYLAAASLGESQYGHYVTAAALSNAIQRISRVMLLCEENPGINLSREVLEVLKDA